MPAALPQDKANELIHFINAMLLDGIDHARLEDIRSEADKLEKFGAYVDAKRVKGMIAALSGDVKEVDRHFNAAVMASGKDVVVLIDYAAALGNIHYHARAIDVIDEAVHRTPDDLDALNLSLKIHSDAFDVDGTRNIAEQLDKLGQPNNDPILFAKLNAVESIQSVQGTSWRQMSERIELVADTLHKLGLTPRVCTEIQSDGVMLYEFNLDADIATVMAAENAVHEAIANQPFSPADRAIAFSCAQI